MEIRLSVLIVSNRLTFLEKKKKIIKKGHWSLVDYLMLPRAYIHFVCLFISKGVLVCLTKHITCPYRSYIYIKVEVKVWKCVSVILG